MTPKTVDFRVLDKIAPSDNPVIGDKAPRRAFVKRSRKMAEVITAEEQARKDAMEAAEKAAEATNATRNGKGTYLAVSSTRGKNPTPITYESFDESKPDTLPESVAEFVSLTGIGDEAALVAYLITGFNDNSFRIASDPVAEFVNSAWPAEVQKSFKDSVKTLVKNGVFGSIEDAVTLLKPQVEAKFGSSVAA